MPTENELFCNVTKKITEKYRVVNFISKRVRQLQDGAEPKIDSEEAEEMSILKIALEEIDRGKISMLSRKKSKSKSKTS